VGGMEEGMEEGKEEGGEAGHGGAQLVEKAGGAGAEAAHGAEGAGGLILVLILIGLFGTHFWIFGIIFIELIRQDPVLVQGEGEDEKVLLLRRLGCFWQCVREWRQRLSWFV